MKITRAYAQEIVNSLGMLTVECVLECADGKIIRSAAACGQSIGPFEQKEPAVNPFAGPGSSDVVKQFNAVIQPLLQGSEPNIIAFDSCIDDARAFREGLLSGMITIAASQAVAKAQAYIHQLSLFELLSYICKYDTVSLPTPMFNCINAGVHSSSPCPVQEILLVPVGYETYAHALYATQLFFARLKEQIAIAGYPLCVGDEGGFVLPNADERIALDLIMHTMEKSSYSALISLDIAAGQLYDPLSKQYRWGSHHYSTAQLLEHISTLAGSYPCFSIEDPLAPQDSAWDVVSSELPSVHIIADDLVATDPLRTHEAIRNYQIAGAVIKPNQAGTVTRTLQAALALSEEERHIIVSHRSADTCDTFIADLAVGVHALAIKAGGLSRAEHTSKYNRLLAIEEYLQRVAQQY